MRPIHQSQVVQRIPGGVMKNTNNGNNFNYIQPQFTAPLLNQPSMRNHSMPVRIINQNNLTSQFQNVSANHLQVLQMQTVPSVHRPGRLIVQNHHIRGGSVIYTSSDSRGNTSSINGSTFLSNQLIEPFQRSAIASSNNIINVHQLLPQKQAIRFHSESHNDQSRFSQYTSSTGPILFDPSMSLRNSRVSQSVQLQPITRIPVVQRGATPQTVSSVDRTQKSISFSQPILTASPPKTIAATDWIQTSQKQRPQQFIAGPSPSMMAFAHPISQQSNHNSAMASPINSLSQSLINNLPISPLTTSFVSQRPTTISFHAPQAQNKQTSQVFDQSPQQQPQSTAFTSPPPAWMKTSRSNSACSRQENPIDNGTSSMAQNYTAEGCYSARSQSDNQQRIIDILARPVNEDFHQPVLTYADYLNIYGNLTHNLSSPAQQLQPPINDHIEQEEEVVKRQQPQQQQQQQLPRKLSPIKITDRWSPSSENLYFTPDYFSTASRQIAVTAISTTNPPALSHVEENEELSSVVSVSNLPARLASLSEEKQLDTSKYLTSEVLHHQQQQSRFENPAFLLLRPSLDLESPVFTIPAEKSKFDIQPHSSSPHASMNGYSSLKPLSIFTNQPPFTLSSGDIPNYYAEAKNQQQPQTNAQATTKSLIQATSPIFQSSLQSISTQIPPYHSISQTFISSAQIAPYTVFLPSSTMQVEPHTTSKQKLPSHVHHACSSVSVTGDAKHSERFTGGVQSVQPHLHLPLSDNAIFKNGSFLVGLSSSPVAHGPRSIDRGQFPESSIKKHPNGSPPMIDCLIEYEQSKEQSEKKKLDFSHQAARDYTPSHIKDRSNRFENEDDILLRSCDNFSTQPSQLNYEAISHHHQQQRRQFTDGMFTEERNANDDSEQVKRSAITATSLSDQLQPPRRIVTEESISDVRDITLTEMERELEILQEKIESGKRENSRRSKKGITVGAATRKNYHTSNRHSISSQQSDDDTITSHHRIDSNNVEQLEKCITLELQSLLPALTLNQTEELSIRISKNILKILSVEDRSKCSWDNSSLLNGSQIRPTDNDSRLERSQIVQQTSDAMPAVATVTDSKQQSKNQVDLTPIREVDKSDHVYTHQNSAVDATAEESDHQILEDQEEEEDHVYTHQNSAVDATAEKSDHQILEDQEEEEEDNEEKENQQTKEQNEHMLGELQPEDIQQMKGEVDMCEVGVCKEQQADVSRDTQRQKSCIIKTNGETLQVKLLDLKQMVVTAPPQESNLMRALKLAGMSDVRSSCTTRTRATTASSVGNQTHKNKSVTPTSSHLPRSTKQITGAASFAAPTPKTRTSRSSQSPPPSIKRSHIIDEKKKLLTSQREAIRSILQSKKSASTIDESPPNRSQTTISHNKKPVCGSFESEYLKKCRADRGMKHEETLLQIKSNLQTKKRILR